MAPAPTEQEIIEAHEKKIESLTQLVAAYAAELEGCRKLILGEIPSCPNLNRKIIISEITVLAQIMKRPEIGLMPAWLWKGTAIRCFLQRSLKPSS
jgi:hypothetical protein